MKMTVDISPEKFLAPTKLIESDHPAIIKKAEEITSDALHAEDKARNIFYFIRDQISYEFKASFDEKAYFASEILKAGGGFCTQKTILFCALARNCGIPAGLYFYDIVDYTLPQYIIDIIKTRTLYHHGITALYLNNRWIQYDATLDYQLTLRKQRYPVEFSPDHDCLMRTKTRTGEKHIEYIHDYGLYPDVTIDEIVQWLKEGYPHLVEILSNME